jgi:hypothetical protein
MSATALRWFGVLVVAAIAVQIARSAVSAIRSQRFGPHYVTWRGLASASVALIMFLVFYYGVFVYPDSPIDPCSGPTGYCGKQGQPHSLAEYQDFAHWQTTLSIVWPVGMLALAFLYRKEFLSFRR